jgi:nitrite reductase (NO-forming)
MKKARLLLINSLVLATLASCGSSVQKEEAPPFTVGDTGPTSKTESGESIYKRTCVTCHQANGEGLPNVYPPLAKSDFLADKEKAIHQVIKGYTGELIVNGKTYNNTMPPQQLDDAEVASVLTYVYGSFGNSGGTITPDEVKAVRAKP